MKASSKVFLLSIIIVLLAVDIYVIYLDLLAVACFRNQLKDIIKSNLLLFVQIFLIVAYAEIIFHELGHFFSGKLFDFEFYSFGIFPFLIKKENSKIKFSKNLNSYGICLMLPRDCKNKFSLYFIHIFCGPLFDFLIFLFSSIIFISLTRNREAFAFLASTLFILICFSQFSFILNLVPSKPRVNTTDGTKLLYIIRNSDQDKKEIRHMLVSSQLHAGIRPKEIDFGYTDDNEPSLKHDLLIDFYMYYKYLDENNHNKVLYYIEKMENFKHDYYQIVGNSVNHELFYWYCISENKENAEKFSKLIENTIILESEITACRIKMTYELYIRKNLEKAANLGKIGLSSKNAHPIRGLAEFEAAQIENMLKFEDFRKVAGNFT